MCLSHYLMHSQHYVSVSDINYCYFSSLGMWEWQYLISQIYGKDLGSYQNEPSAWHVVEAQ